MGVMKFGVKGLVVPGVMFVICAFSQAGGAISVFVDPHAVNVTVVKRFDLTVPNILTSAGTYTGGMESATGLAFDPHLRRLLETAEIAGDPVKVFNVDNPNAQPESITLSPYNEMAGIVADVGKQKVYVTRRTLPNLFVLNWDTSQGKYVPESLTPHTLNDIGNLVLGLALDETNGRLYAANRSTTIRCYSTTNWSHDTQHDITVSEDATGIAFDYIRGFLYAGTMDDDADTETNYLIQYDVANHTERKVDVGEIVMGVAVDQPTGIVYITTFTEGDSHLYMYSPIDMTRIGPASNPPIGEAAGIAVGNTKSTTMQIAVTEDTSGCVTLGATKYYTVTVNPSGHDQLNTVLRLHVSCDPYSVIPIPGSYPDPATGDWVVSLGNLYASAGAVTRHYGVIADTRTAEPGGSIVSQVSAESDTSFCTAWRETKVCCDSGTVIYVNSQAVPGRNGTSWANAYTDLNKALRRAGYACTAKTVWVAGGIYSPGSDPTSSFAVPGGVSVYGAFSGNETDPCQRNLDFVKTILDGALPDNERIAKIVAMGSGSLLSDIVVQGGNRGIWGLGADFTLQRCEVASNTVNGVDVKNGSPTIKWCTIVDNGENGVYAYADTAYLPTTTVANTLILRNGRNGAYAKGGTPIVKNSVIVDNGYLDGVYWGRIFAALQFDSPAGRPIVRNCTIVDNAECAVRRGGVGDDTTAPDVRNSILWGNGWTPDGYRRQFEGGMGVFYSCVTNWTDGNDCTCLSPQFAYTDPNTPLGWHLLPTSPCKNAGDPFTSYAGEKDIDNEGRVYDGTNVDIGADEVTCENLSSPRDWNHDGAVDACELAIFVDALLSHYSNDPNLRSPNWDSRADLCTVGTSNGFIDLYDFSAFASAYGWHACWHPPISPLAMVQQQVAGGGDPNGYYDPNMPYDPNQWGDPNQPSDPNQPWDPNDPNGYGMMSMQSSMSRASSSTNPAPTYDGVTAQELQAAIDLLYEVAAEGTPEDAAILYEFIPTLEDELSEFYRTVPGYDFTQ